ncbi:hypothetical protein Pat9b_4623 (plasmid) [Pantoea sp. At-9b]|nr:hypothetical protein Pat9b_4623 [Pantoea sp. At-9b]
MYICPDQVICDSETKIYCWYNKAVEFIAREFVTLSPLKTTYGSISYWFKEGRT